MVAFSDHTAPGNLAILRTVMSELLKDVSFVNVMHVMAFCWPLICDMLNSPMDKGPSV